MSQIATDHFSLDTSNMVSDICKPLTKILNVNLFIYQRSIINEKLMCVETNAYLCNYPEVLKFILSLAPKNREPAKYDYSKIRKYILLDSTQPGFTTMLRDKFKINNLMSRDERIGTYEWEHLIIGTAQYAKNILFNAEKITFSNPIEDEDDLIHTKDRIITIRKGKATGKLLGGSLTLLTSLLGTKYLPKFKGAILFVEDIDEDIYRIDRMSIIRLDPFSQNIS